MTRTGSILWELQVGRLSGKRRHSEGNTFLENSQLPQESLGHPIDALGSHNPNVQGQKLGTMTVCF
jgi:hypothetical protein